MKFRTLALALALSCGLTAVGEAKTKTVHRVSSKRGRNSKAYKASKSKVHKAKGVKRVKRVKSRRR